MPKYVAEQKLEIDSTDFDENLSKEFVYNNTEHTSRDLYSRLDPDDVCQSGRNQGGQLVKNKYLK